MERGEKIKEENYQGNSRKTAVMEVEKNGNRYRGVCRKKRK